MNNYKLPGINIDIKQKCQEKKLSFRQICDIVNNNIFLTPPFQISLDQDKIDDMVKSYIENEDYIIFKNKIVVAVINETKLYLIDGHHRVQMAKTLYEKNYDNYLICCYFLVENDNMMRNLFIEINKDSYKNYQYITLDDFNIKTVDLLKSYLKNKYDFYFANKKSKEKYIYTIDEFISKLIDNNYINCFKNIDNIIYDIEDKNNIYNKIINYQELFLENNDNFYKDEFYCVRDGKIFSLKNNNFLDFLLNSKIIPEHKYKNKKIKIKISPKLRIEVWKKYYGENLEAKCPICDYKIGYSSGFHCGHIISEKNNGATDISNLKPLCANCNYKMGSKNWSDYIKI